MVRLPDCDECYDGAYVTSAAEAQELTRSFLRRTEETDHLAEIFAADGWDGDELNSMAYVLHDRCAPFLEDAAGMLEELARIVRLHVHRRSQLPA